MEGPIFDATQYSPDQGGTSHPIGRFPFQISGTDITPTKENDGYKFEVEYSTPAGKIIQRFNLWNKSAQAVEIAHKQLSALCHATGIYKLDMNTKGAALLNARGQIDVRQQQGNTQYTEVGRIYDVNGNEPGKPPGTPQAPAPQPAPAAPAWNAQPGPQGPLATTAAPFAPAPAPQQPWAQPQPAPQPAPAPANQPWAPGGAPPAQAPWGPGR